MKMISNLKKMAIVAALVLGVASCSDDDDGNGGNPDVDGTTIVEIAANTDNLSILVQALQRVNLVDILNGTENFTVLAPTNDAFAAFLAASEEYDALADIPDDVLTQVLLNHVISGEVLSSALTDSGYANTLATLADDDDDDSNNANISLYYDNDDGELEFNGTANVSEADIDASNGVIHIVDAVVPIPTVTNAISYNSNLSTLVSALGDTDLDGIAADLGGATILAPTNDAFQALLDGDDNLNSLTDIPDASNVLSNHIIGSPISSEVLTSVGNAYTTTLAQVDTDNDDDFLSIYYNTTNGVTFNGISNVSMADIVTSNGIIHIVDAVITLPTVTTFVAADPTFSTLLAALTDLTPNTDFAGILSRTDDDNNDDVDPPFTVFAPTDTGFTDFDATIGEDAIANILLGHVISGNYILSGDLEDGDVSTLNGDISIAIDDTSGDAMVQGNSNNDGISIISVDIKAINGVIHAIDGVILP